MKAEGRWVLLVPVVCFAIGVWFFTADRTDVKVSFERAKAFWRQGSYHEAAQAYLELRKEFPASPLAAESLWEAGTIYYYNLYDIANAIHCFERVIDEFPESRWTSGAHLRLAEIFEVELNEPGNALRHWHEALAGPIDATTRRGLEFRIAEAHFKLNEFGLAFEEFGRLARDPSVDSHLGRQATLRLGVIYQIRHDHEAAIRTFQEVLDEDPCSDCRLHAQLGLIESLEVLDRLVEAIAVARDIRPEDYPDEMRQKLLDRLLEKRKYYEPKLWGGL